MHRARALLGPRGARPKPSVLNQLKLSLRPSTEPPAGYSTVLAKLSKSIPADRSLEPEALKAQSEKKAMFIEGQLQAMQDRRTNRPSPSPSPPSYSLKFRREPFSPQSLPSFGPSRPAQSSSFTSSESASPSHLAITLTRRELSLLFSPSSDPSHHSPIIRFPAAIDRVQGRIADGLPETRHPAVRAFHQALWDVDIQALEMQYPETLRDETVLLSSADYDHLVYVLSSRSPPSPLLNRAILDAQRFFGPPPTLANALAVFHLALAAQLPLDAFRAVASSILETERHPPSEFDLLVLLQTALADPSSTRDPWLVLDSLLSIDLPPHLVTFHLFVRSLLAGPVVGLQARVERAVELFRSLGLDEIEMELSLSRFLGFANRIGVKERSEVLTRVTEVLAGSSIMSLETRLLKLAGDDDVHRLNAAVVFANYTLEQKMLERPTRLRKLRRALVAALPEELTAKHLQRLQETKKRRWLRQGLGSISHSGEFVAELVRCGSKDGRMLSLERALHVCTHFPLHKPFGLWNAFYVIEDLRDAVQSSTSAQDIDNVVTLAAQMIRGERPKYLGGNVPLLPISPFESTAPPGSPPIKSPLTEYYTALDRILTSLLALIAISTAPNLRLIVIQPVIDAILFHANDKHPNLLPFPPRIYNLLLEFIPNATEPAEVAAVYSLLEQTRASHSVLSRADAAFLSRFSSPPAVADQAWAALLGSCSRVSRDHPSDERTLSLLRRLVAQDSQEIRDLIETSNAFRRRMAAVSSRLTDTSKQKAQRARWDALIRRMQEVRTMIGEKLGSEWEWLREEVDGVVRLKVEGVEAAPGLDDDPSDSGEEVSHSVTLFNPFNLGTSARPPSRHRSFLERERDPTTPPTEMGEPDSSAGAMSSSSEAQNGSDTVAEANEPQHQDEHARSSSPSHG